MIRPMRQPDAPEVLALLEWMDEQPEREVFAPEARDLDDLRLESEDKRCWVAEDDLGQVRAYCALAPHPHGLVLEGPLGEARLPAMLTQAVREAQGQGVYAFCARDNEPVHAVLAAAGFTVMHGTDFYRLRRGEARGLTALPPGLLLRLRTDLSTYQRLYRAAEDGWSERLGWSEADFQAHLMRDDRCLLVLMRGEAALGFVELELGETAELAYFAVHPAERGQGLGRVLLSAAIREAFARPEVQALRVRAHDHEDGARALYAHMGFTACRSVMTYLYPGDDGEV